MRRSLAVVVSFRSIGAPQRFRLTAARVSTVDRSWAAAVVRPQGGEGALVVFASGPRGWLVADIGTARVGCNPKLRIPRAVRADLGLSC